MDENIETVARYRHDGKLYEIDHLGILGTQGCATGDDQWGQFAVYLNHGDGGATQVAEFAIEESALKPEFRPAELPVTTAELIELAKHAVAED